MQHLDRLLSTYGAPTLAGLKAASLICVPREILPGVGREIASTARQFAAQGVRFRFLHACEHRALLLVYRPKQLLQDLSDPLARELLEQENYPLSDGLHVLLNRLAQRMNGEVFPHEIGLFLGYPPDDVQGFIVHQGRGCKLCGYWKVYGDPVRARALFAQYDSCRAQACMRIEEGASALELCTA